MVKLCFIGIFWYIYGSFLMSFLVQFWCHFDVILMSFWSIFAHFCSFFFIFVTFLSHFYSFSSLFLLFSCSFLLFFSSFPSSAPPFSQQPTATMPFLSGRSSSSTSATTPPPSATSAAHLSSLTFPCRPPSSQTSLCRRRFWCTCLGSWWTRCSVCCCLGWKLGVILEG